MSDYTNLQKISQENASHLAKFFIKSEKNFLLFGRRGTGKTEIILQAIKECKYKVSYINLSVMERCDLGGYPNINSNNDVVTFKSPHFLPKLEERKKPDTVLLFDEVDKCSPETTAPLLEILQFRKINGVPLNIVSCMLTSNMINESAHSNIISSALLDRVSKYILDFDMTNWLDWAKSNNVHDLILGFLRSHPDLACGVMEGVFVSPSPRAWTLASEAIIQAHELKIVDIETITSIISGYVGSEAGLKFKIWYEHYRKFEPIIHSLIDKGSTNFAFNELMPTEKIIFVISACYYAKQKVFGEPFKNKNRLIYLEHLCKFLQYYKVDHEVQVMAFYNAFSFEQIATHKLYESTIFFEHFNKLNEGVIIKK